MVGCLCEYCENVNLKIESIDKVAESSGKNVKLNNKYAMLDLTMCKKAEDDQYQDIACIKRTCKNCGVYKLKKST